MKEKKKNICCLLHFHPQPTQQDTESSDLTNRSNSSSATGRCYFYIRLCYVYIYIYVWNFRINEFENFQKQKLGFRWEKTKRHVFFQILQILKFTWTSAESTPTSETNASGFGSLASMQQRSKVKSPPQQPGFPSRLLKESLKKSLKGAFGGKKLRKLDEKYD